MQRAAGLLAIVSSLLLGLGLGSASIASAQGVVVIVNSANRVETVSMQDLARIYKLSRKSWPDGTPISLYLPPPSSPAAKLLATRVLNVGRETDVFTFYLRAIFRQQITAVPETAPAAPVAIERVAASPGGIALLERGEVPANGRVRVIQIDGL